MIYIKALIWFVALLGSFVLWLPVTPLGYLSYGTVVVTVHVLHRAGLIGAPAVSFVRAKRDAFAYPLTALARHIEQRRI